MVESLVTAAPSPPAEHRAPETPEFPGCHPVYISREDIAAYEGRYEFWDADTETAMVCEPTSYYHERPLHRLAKLSDRIAAARGAPIEAVGHTDLLLRNARGERQRIMQADQILFLRPVRTIPRGAYGRSRRGLGARTGRRPKGGDAGGSASGVRIARYRRFGFLAGAARGDGRSLCRGAGASGDGMS